MNFYCAEYMTNVVSIVSDETVRLPMGKIPSEILRKSVFGRLGVENKDVILGPSLGEDGAVVRVGDKVVISAIDSISGATDQIGFLAVNINANDVATFGVKPDFFSSCLLLPEYSNEKIVKKICGQIDRAAKKLEIAVIGGHSEVTPELNRPIIVGCAMGISEPGHYVISGGSKPGDKLILTKGAGIEGTAILATEMRTKLKQKLSKTLLDSAEKFYDQISIVKEAILAFNIGGVTAMHDPTEGGITGGIHELADAANLGVIVTEDKISIAQETYEICRFFELDPLQLIGSGALLISAESSLTQAIIKELVCKGIETTIIGEFTGYHEKRVIIRSDGSETELTRPLFDHLWLALEKEDR